MFEFLLGLLGIGGSYYTNQQSAEAALEAAKLQYDAAMAGIGVEKDRLEMEQQRYLDQMDEYRRRQELVEQQQAQSITNLAPYIQGGQSALYEMYALAGLPAPTGVSQGPTFTPRTQDQTIGYQTSTQQGPIMGATTPTVQKVGGLTGSIAPTGRTSTIGGLSQSFLENYPPGTYETGTTGGTTFVTPRPDSGPGVLEGYPSGTYKTRTIGGTPVITSSGSGLRGVLEPVIAEATRRAEEEAAAQAAIGQGTLDTAIPGAGSITANLPVRTSIPVINPAENQYAGLTGDQAQASALSKITNNAIVNELMRQGEQGILQNVAATGGLRGGNVQGVLARYRPSVIQSEIDKQWSRLQGLSSTGQQSILGSPTTAGTTQPSTSVSQSNISGLLGDAAAAQAGGTLSSAYYNNQFLDDLLAFATKFGQGFGSNSTNYTSTPTGFGTSDTTTYYDPTWSGTY